jgi:4-hydroxy-tetrahydrodipicolinate synthase
VRTVVSAARGRAHTLVGTGTNATHTTLERSLEALRLGADGVLVVSPYYNKPSQEGLYRHYAAVCGTLEDLPVVLYNVPGRTASNIAPSTVLQIARDFPNAAGIKEASGNFSQLSTILRRRPEGFLVLAGDDALALPSIALGADGLVSVVSNEAPELARRLVDAALEGDLATARALHYRLLPLMEANFLETNPVPAKAALAMLGLIGDHCRLPLLAASGDTRAALREALLAADLRPAESSSPAREHAAVA